MGCWNATCGLSNQSINIGTPVIGFVTINNQVTTDEGCSHELSGVPLTLPVHGKYDDYGSMENVVEDFGSVSTVALFNTYIDNGMLVLTKYSNGDGDTTDTFDGYFDSVEGIFHEIERGHLKLKKANHYTKICTYELNLVMFRQDAWLSMLETIENCNDYEVKDVSLKNILADVQIMIDKELSTPPVKDVEAAIDEINRKLTTLTTDALAEEQMMDLLEQRQSLRDQSRGGSSWGGDRLKSSYSEWSNICRVLNADELVETKSLQHLFNISKELYCELINDEIANNITQFILTLKMFQLFRKSWIPQYNTSQHDGLDVNIEYLERQLARLKVERQAKIDDGWYADDEDERLPEIILNTYSVLENGMLSKQEK